MAEAANKNNRVVQCGTQQRPGEHFKKVTELLRSGRIGRVTEADTWTLRGTSDANALSRYRPAGGSRLGHVAGSGALSPLQPQSPYGMGRLLGDRRRRANELGASLDRYRSLGTRRRRPADGGRFRRQLISSGVFEIPDTIEAAYEYPGTRVNENGFLVKFYNRAGRGPDNHQYGMEFYGTEGTLFVNREGYTI